MSDIRFYVLAHDTARRLAAARCMTAPAGWVVRITPPTRTLEQNARLWVLLNEIAEHVVWHGRKLDAESWKHIFTSSLKKMDVVPNLEGTGFVALGLSTSKMSRAELSDLMMLIEAFAASHGISLGDEAAK